MTASPPIRMPAVLLMSFGSPRGPEEVEQLLTSVLGRTPSPAMLAELTARYRRINWSPLLEITRRQAEAVERELAAWRPAVVRPAMLHASPTIAEAVREVTELGGDLIIGVPMSPQLSPQVPRYWSAMQGAQGTRIPRVPMAVSSDWHLHPGFVDALAARLRSTLEWTVEPQVVFTAHSVPRHDGRAAAYAGQVQETAAAVAAAVGLCAGRWEVAYQSASGPAGSWLGPDILERVEAVGRSRRHELVVVPVQFLADHLEVLYDLDVCVREAAERVGIRYLRPPSLNADSALVSVLADVVMATAARCGVDADGDCPPMSAS